MYSFVILLLLYISDCSMSSVNVQMYYWTRYLLITSLVSMFTSHNDSIRYERKIILSTPWRKRRWKFSLQRWDCYVSWGNTSLLRSLKNCCFSLPTMRLQEPWKELSHLAVPFPSFVKPLLALKDHFPVYHSCLLKQVLPPLPLP